MKANEKAAGKTANVSGARVRPLTGTAKVAAIGRKRAYWNRDKGGIILTTEYQGNDYNGVHWRVLLDGGNKYGGKVHWIAGRASGGGYNVRGDALAQAVRGVIGCNDAEKIGWANSGEWAAAAAEMGWTLYIFGEESAVVLIPGAEVSDKIAAEIKAEQANG